MAETVPPPRRCFADLHDFLHALEAAGEVVRVPFEVDPYLEISALTDLQCKAPGGGKALLFERVKGSRWPVAINLFGSERRMCMALGVETLEEPGRRLRALLELPAGGLGVGELLSRLHALSRFRPRRVRTAPCKEVVERDPDLTELPVITAWPEDGGPFISLPLVFSRSPAGGPPNVGMYRMQLYDRTTTGMHWHIHKHGAAHLDEAAGRGERLPVAVALGGDPA
ncbi:MAG: menaquinone biosynthesis decarboxylase, partial [Nitrospirae bacterium]